MRGRPDSFGDFKCAHCHALVSGAHILSGVNNRNHCPYCLWSCHLDLFAAGDRLCACKAPMKPIALTMKRGRNKYQREASGELMLVHVCTECNALSINRVAADDDPAAIMSVFQASASLGHPMYVLAQQHGISILTERDASIVQSQLYGRVVEIRASGWN